MPKLVDKKDAKGEVEDKSEEKVEKSKEKQKSGEKIYIPPKLKSKQKG